MRAVADRFDVSPFRLRRAIVDAGLTVRGRAPVPRIDCDELRELYVDAGLSLTAIAQRLGVSTSGVSNALHRCGIPRRRGATIDHVDDDELRRLYVDEELTAREVGERLGCSSRLVLGYLHDNAIPVRPPGPRRPGTRVLLDLIENLFDARKQRRAGWVGLELAEVCISFGAELRFAHTTTQLVELDSRRRVALGKIGNPEHNRYLVHSEPDGTLIFSPAVVMTAHDAALLRNPDLLAQIDSALDDRSKAVRRSQRKNR